MAMACLAPQGINGCGFEQPLEAMYQGLTRSDTDGEDEVGFIRAEAHLVVVFVTDEADCSYKDEWSEIFEPDGDRVFWSDPESSFPTSAVCWNAGVACTGGSGTPYDECHAVDYDVSGNETDAASSVLHPLSRYVDRLDEIEQQKVAGEVRVMAIFGQTAEGDFVYSDASATDPEFMDTYGIGPGCRSGEIDGVPPVRIRELANMVNPAPDEGFYSICSPDFAPILEDIADRVVQLSTP